MTREDTTIVAPATPGGRAPSRRAPLGTRRVPGAGRLTGLSPSDAPRGPCDGVPSATSPANPRHRTGRFFPEPNSFTGEDVAEFHLSRQSRGGGDRRTAACARRPCRRSRGSSPGGRFTGGKMDLNPSGGPLRPHRRADGAAARSALAADARRHPEEVVRCGSGSSPSHAPGGGDRLRGRGRMSRRFQDSNCRNRVSKSLIGWRSSFGRTRRGAGFGTGDGRDPGVANVGKSRLAQPLGGGGARNRDGDPGRRGIIFTPHFRRRRAGDL